MAIIPSDLYNQILTYLPIACVDIAIVSKGSILLVKRNDMPVKGEWWLPGGRVNKYETMRQTAKRKAIEEVGLHCHIGPIIHTAETIFQDGPNGIPVHSINSCFMLYPVDSISEVKIDEHHSDFDWFDFIASGLHPYVKTCLSKAGLE